MNSSCFVGSTWFRTCQGPLAGRGVRIGRRMQTWLDDETHLRGLATAPFPYSPAELRHVFLFVRHPDGTACRVELLHSLDWIEDYGAHVGGSIFLDMPEMGVEGQAEVLAIEPCPPLEEGEGRLVTGTFKHTSGEVYDLKFESEIKPIGVTATHPFWSVDRNAWVSAVDLEIGETLKTLAGTTVVESRSKRQAPETVYNIEVEGDHCYRVGESGVLVHNQSAPDCCDPPPSTRARSSTLGTNLASGPNADVASSTVSKQPEAHHIVAGAAGASESREIIAEFPVCIGINDAINGVWLPKTSGVTVPASTNPLGRVFHNRTFTPRYYEYVLAQLRPVRGNRASVEAVLSALRSELASGQVNW